MCDFKLFLKSLHTKKVFVIKKLVKFVFDVINGMWRDNVSAYSAQSAFFVTISFIPFVMLLISLLRFLPFTRQELIGQAIEIFPGAAKSFVTSFLSEAYQKSDAALISITAVSALWASSIGVFTVSRGLNRVFCTDETRNYFVIRFISLIYTLVLMALIVLCLGILVFGNAITETLAQNLPEAFGVAIIIMSLRKITGWIVLTLFFAFLFTFVPNRKGKFWIQIPGAAISAFGWIVFSSVFSYYYEHMSSYSYLYGSLSVLVFFMLWLFFCIYILFIGAEISKCIEVRLENAKLMK